MSVYLDYNASAPIDERVLDVMIDVYRNSYGNADSRTHDYGEEARRVVENARRQVASLLNVNSDEVFFTSGSTESNNIAIRGLIEFAKETNKKHFITSSIEHKAVLECFKLLNNNGFDVDIIEPGENGRISAEEVLRRVRDDTVLVSIMHANNETGIIQPVDEIGDGLKDRDIFFHIDATQSCGKLVTDIQNLSYDMLSLSAHKFGGPQGVGALILKRDNYVLPPVKSIMFGGQQEHGIRPGTIPVALVAGLGVACELSEKEYEDNILKCKDIKQSILHELDGSGLNYVINGVQEFCMPNTLNLSVIGVESEALMIASKQYCGISNGSACTSHDYAPSYVLSAMRLDTNRISSAIRISWGPNSRKSEIIDGIRGLVDIAKGFLF